MSSDCTLTKPTPSFQGRGQYNLGIHEMYRTNQLQRYIKHVGHLNETTVDITGITVRHRGGGW